ncbi:MAG: alpha/beta fold hydrolase [Actinomycetota bacterium]
MKSVVLVHGFGSSFAHGWVETGWVDILGDMGRPVVGVDLLGHGDAPRPHDPAAYEHGLADSVLDVLPPEPVDAIGFSLGAVTLLRLAIDDSTRFNRLVVIGVGEHTMHATSDPRGVGFESRVFAQLVDAERNDREALEACWRRPHDHLSAAALATITLPVLVITSDGDELAGSPGPLANALADGSLVTLRAIDHFQTPRDFACIDAAIQFLDGG